MAYIGLIFFVFLFIRDCLLFLRLKFIRISHSLLMLSTSGRKKTTLPLRPSRRSSSPERSPDPGSKLFIKDSQEHSKDNTEPCIHSWCIETGNWLENWNCPACGDLEKRWFFHCYYCRIKRCAKCAGISFLSTGSH